ncbi:hypothetical protein OJAV_G00039750 [Oryzias javanicus]|uniref:Uncharacterized protein n=1 Tax=Oryzias javanicus TaxID=123683 RepID=A0A3S2MRH2_ORYJA|nr:hypothetical protein OJAV_G00039750 [Oryzias javanicus]
MGAVLRGRLESVNYIKPKRASNRQPCSSGESIDQHGIVPSQSHPLNLSQVHSVVSSSQERSGPSHSDPSLRRHQTYPPAVPASHYTFPEVSALAAGPAAASSLYTYPASAALSSASQAMEQLLGHGQSSQGHSPSAYAPTYTSSSSSSSRRDSSSQKDSVSSRLHALPAAYQHQFSAGSPYVSVTPRAEAYSAYQLSPRRLAQYPYL